MQIQKVFKKKKIISKNYKNYKFKKNIEIISFIPFYYNFF